MKYSTYDGVVFNSNGEFGVLYSGAYRYKWNNGSRKLMFYPPLVLYLSSGNGNSRDLVNCDSNGLSQKGKEIIKNLFQETGKKSYYEDIKYLKIKWIPFGEKFRISESNGYEVVECYNDNEWIDPIINNTTKAYL
ncbi:hypothetical protein Indivirus_2_115 [Indivirus ILV1]|uniref:Uncharacterized protein n=1 Tax=Indivirus ILV1 TaxID=1977633 RepID=A0A1V0SDE3_9VIRU|nr:hypothetical protein Indivirus_2_115 [Indivirus ILV1]